MFGPKGSTVVLDDKLEMPFKRGKVRPRRKQQKGQPKKSWGKNQAREIMAYERAKGHVNDKFKLILIGDAPTEDAANSLVEAAKRSKQHRISAPKGETSFADIGTLKARAAYILRRRAADIARRGAEAAPYYVSDPEGGYVQTPEGGYVKAAEGETATHGARTGVPEIPADKSIAYSSRLVPDPDDPSKTKREIEKKITDPEVHAKHQEAFAAYQAAVAARDANIKKYMDRYKDLDKLSDDQVLELFDIRLMNNIPADRRQDTIYLKLGKSLKGFDVLDIPKDDPWYEELKAAEAIKKCFPIFDCFSESWYCSKRY